MLITRANNLSWEGKELHPTLAVSFSASFFFFFFNHCNNLKNCACVCAHERHSGRTGWEAYNQGCYIPFSSMHAQSLNHVPLCNPMDCSPPGSSAHGIFQARILEWVAISSSTGSFSPRDRTHISCISYIGRQILSHWVIWEVHLLAELNVNKDQLLSF